MKSAVLTAAICLGFVAGVFGADEVPKDAASTGKPKIKFDQTTYDFGKTSQVEHVTGKFTFQNVGDGVLKIGKPTTSCGCTVAGVKPDVLQPGDKGELTFSLNLGKVRQVFQKSITVESNDPDSPKTMLTVKADYTPLYDVSPASFYLAIRKGQSTNLSARVTRTDGKPLNITKIQPTQSWVEAKAEPDPNSTNGAVRIHATLKPDGSPRYFTEVLQVFTDNPQQPAFNVTFSGRLLGDLTLSPESVYWPITDPEKVVTSRRIVVKSLLPQKLEVTNVSSTLKDVNVETVTKEDGKTMEIIAKLSSIPTTTTNGVIRFETNIPSQQKVEIPVWINIVAKPKQTTQATQTAR